jgi:hypothetical protein
MLTPYLLPLTSYLLPLTFYLLPFTSYLLPLTFYHSPITSYLLRHFLSNRLYRVVGQLQLKGGAFAYITRHF